VGVLKYFKLNIEKIRIACMNIFSVMKAPIRRLP